MTPVISGILGTRVFAWLTTLFNALALNLVMIAASLPLVTAPAAISAASAVLDQWRREGQDQVVRQFIAEFRARWSVRVTLGAGVPLAAVVLGAAEIRFFAREATLAGRVGLGLGAAALLITLTALGYVFLLAARGPALPAAEFWSLCARLAVRNLLITGPLFLTEIAGATVLTLIDPPLLLLGVPVLLLYLMKLTAQFGLRRAGLKQW